MWKEETEKSPEAFWSASVVHTAAKRACLEEWEGEGEHWNTTLGQLCLRALMACHTRS